MGADRFVEVSGARIRYRKEGNGPPVVFIHGLGASLESWEWTIPALRDRHTTITFDLPGFGLSDRMDSAFTPEGAAATTLAFMDAVDVQRGAIIGTSLGGGIAILTAGAAPERCTALVLAAPAGFDRDISLMMRLMTVPLLGEGIVEMVRRSPRLGVQYSFADPRRIPDRLVEITRRDFARPATGASCLKAIRASAGLRGIRSEVLATIQNAAARITAPTLIVWGARDGVIPPIQAAIAARVIPRAHVHTMDGVGHAGFIEDADAFNGVIAGFLAGVEGAVGKGPVRVGARS